MSDLRKAAQQALEALGNVRDYIYLLPDGRITEQDQLSDLRKAIVALRDALAQPEPFNLDWDRVAALEESLREQDELIDVLASAMVKGDKSVNWLCRAIEQAHGIGGES